MEQNAFIMEAISGVVYLIVGVRLYALSRRTGLAPERLIALTFLFWALCYALYDIPYLWNGLEESVPPFFAYTSMLAFNLGNIAFALFTRVGGARSAVAAIVSGLLVWSLGRFALDWAAPYMVALAVSTAAYLVAAALEARPGHPARV